jgi:hypothetical protein
MYPGYRPIQHGQASSQYRSDVDRPNIAGKQIFRGPCFYSTYFPFRLK